MESSSNEGGVDQHTLVDRARKRSKNGDEEAVLDVIQITGDPSAERTAPPRSTHVRSAWRLLLLDLARGEGEVREDSIQK